ncbi:MAG: tRNA (guanosine(46)-N7)-methyltransferase TrmB [Pyrinomonadaceae bacterium]
MPRIRVHQHVNPLAPYFRFAPKPLDLDAVFAHPKSPLHLDIGAVRGRFLLQMSELFPARNFLGIEIREPLVAEANRLKNEKNLTNLRYEFVNATLALDKFLENLPAEILQTVTIQFPDPWYKKKHSKRRMVNKEMVETIARRLAISGKVFIQTDVEFLAAEMFEMFRKNKNFKEISIAKNPFPAKTEREKAVEEKLLPVYRRLFEKVFRADKD